MKREMSKKEINKKGELTIATIITIALLVIAFAIILFFVFRLNWGGMVNEQVCHQSVIYRATLPSTAGVKEYVPLKCKTQKICLTANGEDCKEFENLKGVTKIKVKKEEEGYRQVEKVIATEVVKCWRMMGEGKVTVFTDYLAESWGIGGVGSSCIVCNRIAFNGIDLKEIDVEDYMLRHAIPDGDISYYDFLSGQGGKVSLEDTKKGIEVKGDFYDENGNLDKNAQEGRFEEINEGVDEPNKIKQEEFGEVEMQTFTEDELLKLNEESDELAIVFSQITAPSHGSVLKNTLIAGATLLGLNVRYNPGSFFSTGTKLHPDMVYDSAGKLRWKKGTNVILRGEKAGGQFAKAKTITSVSSKGILVGITALILGIAQQGNVVENRAVTAGYCGDVSMGSEARDGCSVVRTINYNEEDFANYCSVIESIP